MLPAFAALIHVAYTRSLELHSTLKSSRPLFSPRYAISCKHGDTGDVRHVKVRLFRAIFIVVVGLKELISNVFDHGC